MPGTFFNPLNPTELVDIILDYDLKPSQVDTINSKYGVIKLLKKNDLIEMKRKSARPQDLQDILALGGRLMNKTLQIYNKNGANAEGANTDQLLEFLESFRLLNDPSIEKKKSKLISMKIDPDMLKLFRQKCDLEGWLIRQK